MTDSGMVVSDSECVFCAKMSKGFDEHGPVFVTNDPGVLRFEPLNPVVPGHMLFVPRRHDWHSFNVGKAMQAADEHAGLVEHYNLIISRGEAATQTVMHPHVHFVPRREGDGLPLPWSTFSKVTGRLVGGMGGGGVYRGGGGGTGTP